MCYCIDSLGLKASVCAPAKHHPRGPVAARCSVPTLNIKRLPKCDEAVMAEQIHNVLAAQTSSKEIKGMMSPVFLI